MKTFRVATLSGGHENFTDFSDYIEARQYYSNLWRNSGTGDGVEFYEVDGKEERRFLIVNNSLYDAPPFPEIKEVMPEPKPKHLCVPGHGNKCAICRKPYWGG